MYYKDSFLKKLVTARLAYDIESDQRAGEMQSSNTSLQYRYPNGLLRVKKNKKKRIYTLHHSFAI